LAKRLTDKQKEEISQGFIQGKTVSDLSEIFTCTNLTISRNLKKTLGDKKFKEILEKNNNLQKRKKLENHISKDNVEKDLRNEISLKSSLPEGPFSNVLNEDVEISNTFFEIPPLDYEIDDIKQKDLSSIPLSEVNFPEVVYMIVDKKIELEVKYLRDYPSWQFLPDDELNRKTIEIYFDMKIAKRFCNKEQKIIKVPNTDVFKIASPFLISRGISRIVIPERLIAL
tara:strand:+ start:182 stop:862 length:681 start_codon:yes stop_codon:yes gene_type:complete